MVKATELLKLTTLSIADIGTAVGYGNPLHFSRAFKNIYGVSPREWRNEHKQPCIFFLKQYILEKPVSIFIPLEQLKLRRIY